ncbi:MAG TPA: type II CAAX endopeptidase family protein [Terriglobia bacterium]|nr:type II CAAX endopeptidase family protein [Terriglobia bacterium]
MGDLGPSIPPPGNSELPPPSVTAPVPAALHSIFTGPGGIRAGWRLLIFIAIAIVFALILALPLSLSRSQARVGLTSGPISTIIGEAIPFLALLLAARVMAGIEGRAFADYGLSVEGAFGKRFWQGAVWGFVALTALLLATFLAHGFSFGTLALSGPSAVRYAALWAVAFLTVGFLEEFMMRGYALYTLTTGIGFWPAAVLLSALFGSLHLYNLGENWVGELAAALIGLFFCFTVRRTGDLWFAIGLHAAWDYSESFLYSVPDSGVVVTGHLLNSSFHGPRWLTGGAVGPEGSALVFVIIAAMFVLFHRYYRQVKFPPGAKHPRSHLSAISSQQMAAVDSPPSGS